MVYPALKGYREQREKKAIRARRVLTVHRAKRANQVLKARREPKEKKVIRALAVHRVKGVNPELKGSKDPQGQRESLQTPAGCKTLKTALPNWKRDSRRPASVVAQRLLTESPSPPPILPHQGGGDYGGRTRSFTRPVLESTSPSSERRKKGMAAVVRTASVSAASGNRNPRTLAFAWI